MARFGGWSAAHCAAQHGRRLRTLLRRTLSGAPGVAMALLLAAALTATAGQASAAVVRLTSGREIEGKLVERTEAAVTIENFDGRLTIPAARIAAVDESRESAYEKYLALREKTKDDVHGRLTLARECLKGSAWKQAREHVEAALALDPKSRSAEKLLAETAAMEKAWEESRPKPVGVVLKVGVKHEPTPEERKHLEDGAKDAAALFSRITDQAMYFSEFVFTVGSAEGHLVYDREFTGMPNGAVNIPMGTDNWWAPVIVHEAGHALFGLPDDDNAANGGMWGVSEHPCIMAHQWKEGFGPCCRAKLIEKHNVLSALFDRLPQEIEPAPKPQVKFETSK